MELENLDKYYQTQADNYNLTRQFFLFDRKKAISKLQIRPGDVIYDFACGTGRFIYPLFQWWLHKHKVYPEKKIFTFVQQHFIDVKCEVKHFGYSQIITAKNPKP